MAENQDPKFVNGLSFKKRDKSPDFVVGSLSFKIDDLKTFMDQHGKNGWMNADIKKSKAGKFYIELDTWEPNQGQKPASNAGLSTAKDDDDLPF